MSIDNLDKIFQPDSIAVVGASQRAGSVGNALMRNLIDRGFAGKIFPINPNRKTIWDLPVCSSIEELKNGADLAVICTPIAMTPRIIKECADNGVGGADIMSAGVNSLIIAASTQ